MSTTFRPYAPDQMLLLSADLLAWLPEGHLAHHVSDLVDGVDLTAFYAPGHRITWARQCHEPPSVRSTPKATRRVKTTSENVLRRRARIR